MFCADWMNPDVRRKAFIWSLPAIVIFLFQVTNKYDAHVEKEIKQSAGIHQDFDTSKKILYFNNFFHIKDWNFGFGSKPFLNCPVSNCYVTR